MPSANPGDSGRMLTNRNVRNGSKTNCANKPVIIAFFSLTNSKKCSRFISNATPSIMMAKHAFKIVRLCGEN